MTQPRQVLPNEVLLITRRCANRQFLLRPCPATKAVFEYCVAEAAERYGIGVIAWIVMSNHYHMVIVDPEAKVSEFMGRFHSLVAKNLNRHWRRWENFWSVEQACVTKLVNEEDVIDKVVYTLTNPVEAKLVKRVEDWPGSSSWKQMRIQPEKLDPIARPKGFFRESGPMAEKVTLKTQVPTSSRFNSMNEWITYVRAQVREAELRAEDKRRVTGERVPERSALASLSAFDSPKTQELRRKLRPTIACRNKGDRVTALRALKAFRVAYRTAWKQWVARAFDVVFPAGTWLMRMRGALCEPYPAPS
jgi:putative transposase